jgi:hypothetical protein
MSIGMTEQNKNKSTQLWVRRPCKRKCKRENKENKINRRSVGMGIPFVVAHGCVEVAIGNSMFIRNALMGTKKKQKEQRGI